MSDQLKQLLDVPRDFIKDGAFFLNRCTKPSRKGMSPLSITSHLGRSFIALLERLTFAEFIDISRAVGVGFLVMGFIGFAVKLIHIPINNILVLLLLELD